MPYAKKFSDLASMTREELIVYYDETTPHVTIGLDFIRQEIARHDARAANETMINLTKQMRSLTVVISLLTVANVIMVGVVLFT